jgi:hypothetical protein
MGDNATAACEKQYGFILFITVYHKPAGGRQGIKHIANLYFGKHKARDFAVADPLYGNGKQRLVGR